MFGVRNEPNYKWAELEMSRITNEHSVCTHKKDATTYAAKLMEHESSRVLWETFLQESTILRKMKHANVIRIHEVFVDVKFTYGCYSY